MDKKIVYRVFDNPEMIVATYNEGDNFHRFILPCEIIKETKTYYWIKTLHGIEKRKKDAFKETEQEATEFIHKLLKNLVEQGKKAEQVLKNLKKEEK